MASAASSSGGRESIYDCVSSSLSRYRRTTLHAISRSLGVSSTVPLIITALASQFERIGCVRFRSVESGGPVGWMRDGSLGYAMYASRKNSDRVDMRHGPATRLAVANLTVLQRKERVVPAETHILAWMDSSSDLSHENRARRNGFAPEDLHPASLAVTVAAIA